MRETPKSIKIKLWRYGVASSLAFLLPIVAWSGILMPEQEAQASWIQRSGSVMVVWGILVEFRLLSIEGYINPSGATYVVPFDLLESYKISYRLISMLTISVMVFGTIIWGYGDIFIG